MKRLFKEAGITNYPFNIEVPVLKTLKPMEVTIDELNYYSSCDWLTKGRCADNMDLYRCFCEMIWFDKYIEPMFIDEMNNLVLNNHARNVELGTFPAKDGYTVCILYTGTDGYEYEIPKVFIKGKIRITL